MVCGEAARSEVDHLDLAARVALNQDVLRLEVAVDQPEPMHKHQRLDCRQGGDEGEADIDLLVRNMTQRYLFL